MLSLLVYVPVNPAIIASSSMNCCYQPSWIQIIIYILMMLLFMSLITKMLK